MTKARQHERQKRRQADFVTDEEQRLPLTRLPGLAWGMS
jgi:hypothetical protein